MFDQGPGPVCVGDSVLVELRAVRTETTLPDGSVKQGPTTAYVVVGSHNGYVVTWRYPATSQGLTDAWDHAARVFRQAAHMAEGGRMWVDL